MEIKQTAFRTGLNTNWVSFLTAIVCYFLLFLFPVQHLIAQSVPSRNDHIFPSAPQAKPFIDFDSKGFIIHGKRTFIVSAGIEYARVPRGLWYDRLLKLKRAGFNAVEIYTFWNFHEPYEGKFDFSGDQDLAAFLKLVKKMDMYAIVRVGPYYCGEWSLGGFPVWLKFKPGLSVREYNPQFITAVGRFFDKLIPIVAAHQVNHGGPVIMVQLENEHRAAWGTVVPNRYFQFLIDKTVSLGLQVPYFFSGLHPGNDPAGNLKSLDDPKRPNPWFSTEYWGIWFSNYGPQPQDSTIYDRRTWKIISRGGNGYNVYMAHGGTNFAYNNDRDMAASYDYGAAVGQTGDLRPIYYGFKRAAWFARSFQEILANSTDATASKQLSSASDTSLVITGRKSPSGSITFFDNNGTRPLTTRISPPENLKFSAEAGITLAPGEIMPVVHDFSLARGVKLVWAPTRIYRVISEGDLTTLLVYGQSKSAARLYFDLASRPALLKKENFRQLPSGLLEFSAAIQASVPAEYWFETGGHRLRILVLSDQLAQRTWFGEAGLKTNILIGPAYAGELKMKGKRVQLTAERAWQDSIEFPVWLYKPSGEAVRMIKKSQAFPHVTQLELGAWKYKSASQPAAPGYVDQSWKTSSNPPQMGADGDISAYAWYRTTITVPQTGKYTLQFKEIRERAMVFLNGTWIDNLDVSKKSVDIELKGGQTAQLAIFSSHTGRNKQIFYVGPLDVVDAKGLTGPVTIKRADAIGSEIHVLQWKLKGGPGNPNSRQDWKVLSSGRVFNSPQFFKTKFSLPDLKNCRPVWRVITTSLSYGSVWVNGHNLGRYPEKIKINGLYIPEYWLKRKNNTIVIFDENGVVPNGVSVRAETAASRDVTIYLESDRLN